MQKRVYSIIRDDDSNPGLGGRVFDSVLIVLIVLTVLFVILDTFPMPAWYGAVSGGFEVVTSIAFTVEYLLRLWTAPLLYPGMRPGRARIRFLLSFMSLIDLIAILPFYLPFVLPSDLRAIRLLRIFRFLRIFKFGRYFDAIETIVAVIRQKAHQLVSSLIAVGVLILIASVLMYSVEGEAQPDVFPNALSGVWWALSALTNVDYGDIYPITIAGKLLSGVIALLGIAMIAVPTGLISAGFVQAFSASPAPETLRGDLEELRALLADGLLTQEEHDSRRRAILEAKRPLA